MKRRINLASHEASLYASELSAEKNFEESRSLKKVFRYGNYTQYYGYRNPSKCDDSRLRYIPFCWMKSKTILDVGCNTGHFTLSLARKMRPNKVDAIDIDKNLIGIARRNILHYESTNSCKNDESNINNNIAPTSEKTGNCEGKTIGCVCENLEQYHGDERKVSQIVNFACSNFVLTSSALVEMCKPEYDVILMLSVSKWIHLNFRDEGLKRGFDRAYKQLKSTGILILEPQPFESYKKKRKIDPDIARNFQTIQFMPDQFHAYLTGIGFSHWKVLNDETQSSSSFDKRPIIAYFKGDVNSFLCSTSKIINESTVS